MADNGFDAAFERLIGHEGGYVNDARDPGGETKYGISKRAYPGVDIKGLTLDQAKRIYYRDYWIRAGCERVPEPMRFDLFDTAVNSGIGRAVRLLQLAAKVKDDGDLGPVTLRAIEVSDPQGLQARFNGHRLDFLNNLPEWPAFGRGWAQRIAENLMRV